MHPFEFGGAHLFLMGEAALYWPAHKILLVADLHLEKASSYASNGQMLPPYDSLATLQELDRLANMCGARSIICLGDNFHDDTAEMRLQGAAAQLLVQMTQRHDWKWVIGNHDPDIAARWGGTVLTELVIDEIVLRHSAEHGEEKYEISGHYHPKIRITSRGRSVSHRCFLKLETKLVMPAIGSLTGGMDAYEVAHIIGTKHNGDGRHTEIALVAHRAGISQFSLHS